MSESDPVVTQAPPTGPAELPSGRAVARPAGREPAVIAKQLTKRFGERVAVDRIDIELPAGVVSGFVGPNGAGKTTTIAMLLGLMRPTSGTAEVLGHPTSEPASYLPRVGALIEAPSFYPTLSGRRNLEV